MCAAPLRCGWVRALAKGERIFMKLRGQQQPCTHPQLTHMHSRGTRPSCPALKPMHVIRRPLSQACEQNPGKPEILHTRLPGGRLHGISLRSVSLGIKDVSQASTSLWRTLLEPGVSLQSHRSLVARTQADPMRINLRATWLLQQS